MLVKDAVFVCFYKMEQGRGPFYLKKNFGIVPKQFHGIAV
jgi:hypothetical protein